jgi:hypothetical protein
MADANNTAPTEPTRRSISDDLNGIAARLAGVTDALRLVGDNPEDAGSIIHLMADVCERANEQICMTAGLINKLGKGGA